MPEPILLLAALMVAGLVVLPPLWSDAVGEPEGDDADAAAVRHRVALEALRDVEADRRAGSLDDAAYAEQRAEAEARAAATRAALGQPATPAAEPSAFPHGRRAALVGAVAISVLLLIGSLAPASGIANGTVVNERLAAAQASESARQERIAELQDALADDPRDPGTLSKLADAHLAGSTEEDLVRAAVALQLLIELEPGRVDAYERIMTAYLRAGDHANARAAHDAYLALDGADPVEAAFFDGIIALRGEDNPAAARTAFDRFLQLAPHDPRAEMVRGLRDEAAGPRSD